MLGIILKWLKVASGASRHEPFHQDEQDDVKEKRVWLSPWSLTTRQIVGNRTA